MNLGLTGKVAVVTGGFSGIGAALVTALEREGAFVEILDTRTAQPVDVSDEVQVSGAIKRIADQRGRIDALFSNAGILHAGPTEFFSLNEFDRIIAVNLRGAFIVARACLPYLRMTKGAMVFTSSTSALIGSGGEAAYAASKAGIVGLMRSLAAELAPDGVRVNAVAPGWIDTPFNDPVWHYAQAREAEVDAIIAQIPMKRQALPDEVVMAMLMLASPRTTYTTGQVIAVDGGLSVLR